MLTTSESHKEEILCTCKSIVTMANHHLSADCQIPVPSNEDWNKLTLSEALLALRKLRWLVQQIVGVLEK